MNNLPAREELEESTKSMAEMCGLFYKTLVRDGVPHDVAMAAALEYVKGVMGLVRDTS